MVKYHPVFPLAPVVSVQLEDAQRLLLLACTWQIKVLHRNSDSFVFDVPARFFFLLFFDNSIHVYILIILNPHYLLEVTNMSPLYLRVFSCFLSLFNHTV